MPVPVPVAAFPSRTLRIRRRLPDRPTEDGAVQQPSPKLRLTGRQLQGTHGPLSALLPAALGERVAAEPPTENAGRVRISALDGVVECGPDVIGDASEPRPLLLTEAALQRPVRKVPALSKHPGQVAGPHRLKLTVLREQRSPVVPDQDQQPVPGLAVGQLGQRDERAVDEVTQPVQDVERVADGPLPQRASAASRLNEPRNTARRRNRSRSDSPIGS
jgi:hypothetical protein